MKRSIRHVVMIAFGWLGVMAPVEAAPPLASEGSSKESQDVVSNAFLRDQLRSVIEQVVSYRGALKALTSDAKLGTQAKAAEAKVAALVSHSEKLAASNRLPEAISVAEEANRLVVETIAKLRSGETVVVSLSFDSPMDEFAYEQRRFESNEVMVGMLLDEGRASDPQQRKLIEGLNSEGRRLREQAEQNARIGKYAEAVRSMEAANAQMVKAMQNMGVPVF